MKRITNILLILGIGICVVLGARSCFAQAIVYDSFGSGRMAWRTNPVRLACKADSCTLIVRIMKMRDGTDALMLHLRFDDLQIKDGDSATLYFYDMVKGRKTVEYKIECSVTEGVGTSLWLNVFQEFYQLPYLFLHHQMMLAIAVPTLTGAEDLVEVDFKSSEYLLAAIQEMVEK